MPALKRLRSFYPAAPLHLICRKGFGRLFLETGLVDKVHEIEKKNRHSYEKVFEDLKALSFQILLCPHESLTTARLAKKITADKKIGFKKVWNFFFFDERIKKPVNLPESLRQISLLQTLSPQVKEWLFSYEKGDVPTWASAHLDYFTREKALAIAKIHGVSVPFVAIFPGSVWATKQWQEKSFSVVAQKWGSSHQVVWMGSQDERDLCARLKTTVKGSISLAGVTDILETMALLKGADLVITNDSAGQHMASVVGAPTVSIFGPTVPDMGFIPWNTKAIIVESKGVDCRPCGKHGHQACPLGTHQCMKAISADQVYKAGKELVRRTVSNL